MILLGYILLGHGDWNGAEIKIFSVYKGENFIEEKEKLHKIIKEGRLPISPSNLILVKNNENSRIRKIINKKSSDSDLTIVGFKSELLKNQKSDLFNGYENLGNVLFVNSTSEKELIKKEN
jgi:hypothetical protein